SQKFKILVILNVFAHGKSFEHGFVKECIGHKLYTKFTHEVEFRSIFHAPSPKFKILAIPKILAHGKMYEHGFMKKRDGYKLSSKLCAKSSFDQFFVH
ncbi:hypothetical protein GW17_00059577, partial [Ensete ventricosum]